MKHLILSLTAILLISCTSNLKSTFHDPSSDLLGTWHSVAPNGDEITYTFKNGNIIFWQVKSKQGSFKTEANYSLNVDIEPNEIDIYNFTSPQIPVGTKFLGIFKFQSNDKLILLGSPSIEDGSSRPTEFGDESLLFTKENESN